MHSAVLTARPLDQYLAQNWPSRSRMVSQRAVKVGREARDCRCCRNTWGRGQVKER